MPRAIHDDSLEGFSRFNGSVPHPIPYQGSKRQLAPIILSYFPHHSARLVEPFAGSAAISLAVAHYGMADRFLINDAHPPLANLLQEIIERPEQLLKKYRSLWERQAGQEREFYDEVRGEFNKRHEPGLFLYLLARCVKGAIRYNSAGEFNNSPDNRRKGATPSNMAQRVLGASRLLQGKTQVMCLDYKEILSKCDSFDLIYMDPPYQGVCGNRDHRYAPKVDHSEFCEQLAALNEKGCLYVVSYDGRTGSKVYGQPLPKYLKLVHLEIAAGRSTQATLLGRNHETYESLYLSPALADAISYHKRRDRKKNSQKSFAW